jgi:UDP-N-acetylmuramoylalanine--D-glutamate ligase
MHLAGKTIVVVGLGKSGVAAARACLRRGAAMVIGNDAAAEGALSEDARALGREARVRLMAGGHANVPWGDASLIVVSPGVPRESALAASRGVPVVGELELAWSLLAPVPTVAIGGTNGKSTTTSLVGAMLERHRGRVFVGGNIGTALASVVPAESEDAALDALVLEVSSFQAETMRAFRPNAAALLNITADHLDRYASLQAYADAKGEMLARMTKDDVIVVPAKDAPCAAQAARSQARVMTFGAQGDIEVLGDTLVDHVHCARYARSEIKIVGQHNALNAAAAIALASAMGVPEAVVRDTLATFEGLAHRIAVVGEADGVRYYDDSKGTNVGASVAALNGLSEPRAVLIAGGRDKGGSYEPLIEALRTKGRALVVMGEAAETSSRFVAHRRWKTL